MGVNSLRKTVTRQRRGCDLNPGPSAPESSTLTSVTTRLPSHPVRVMPVVLHIDTILYISYYYYYYYYYSRFTASFPGQLG